MGVWDTVGALGLPEELTPLPRKAIQLFGFHDCLLGEHIEAAFQALALNEMRADFASRKVQFVKYNAQIFLSRIAQSSFRQKLEDEKIRL